MTGPETRVESIRVAVWAIVAAGALLAYTHWGAGHPPAWPGQWMAAAGATFLVLALWQTATGKAPRPLLPWVLAGLALAALPDLLARTGVRHARWTDVFALHATIESASVPATVLFAGLIVAAGIFLASCRLVRR